MKHTVQGQKLMRQKLKQALEKAALTKKTNQEAANLATRTSSSKIQSQQVEKKGASTGLREASKKTLGTPEHWPKGPLHKTKQPVLAPVPKTKPKSNLSELQEKMERKLAGAKFRWINEKLYTSNSKDAVKLFKKILNCLKFSQVKDWPVNPVDIFINDLKGLPPFTMVADMGCGEAKVASELGLIIRVHSFDLIAANEHITACDIAHVPLLHKSCDVVIFCLSLMGTNFVDFLKEAYRILKFGGVLKIAEVVSRISDIEEFINGINGIGFRLSKKYTLASEFTLMGVTIGKSKVMQIPIHKTAGLESSQFSRDGNYFSAQSNMGLDAKTLPRQPRVGNNVRNTSDTVFQFGSSMEYKDPQERYNTQVSSHEQGRKHQNRVKLDQRIALKHVHYNPITHEYHNSEGGRELEVKDAQTKNQVAVRATRLYLRSNTFNPMLCADIPKRVDSKQDCSEQSDGASNSNLPYMFNDMSGLTTKTVLNSKLNHLQIRKNKLSNGAMNESSPCNDSPQASNVQNLVRPQYGRRSYKARQSNESSNITGEQRSRFTVITSVSITENECPTNMPSQ
ncbi:hypothetical protein BSLG_009451 [Batrachochytrium salamandrivorans]|nr:hypothetical protein BSLG_009451 [Batrachochytrium salamandrivorans]